MKKSFIIESDCLDIVKRIKTIDKAYFVVFNIENSKFELHHAEQERGTYCLTFPFDVLDERAYLHVLKTRVENADAIFAEIDRQNEKLVSRQIKEVLDDFKEKFYDS